MKQLLSSFIGICCLCFAAQAQKFILANVHSHNDYEQKIPFDLAFRNQLGSIEADIHLVAGKILVGHDAKDLLPSRNLENMYLAPLLASNSPHLKAAVKSLLADQPPKKGIPSSGCNIKWKPGTEPRWFPVGR